MACSLGTCITNIFHERDDCFIGRRVTFLLDVAVKLLHLVSAGNLMAVVLQGTGLIVPYFSSTSSSVCIVITELLSHPQDSMAGQFAWYQMTGVSPHHYFLIHFSRATSSGNHPGPLLPSHSLKTPMQSAETITNQVRFKCVQGT